MTLSQFMHANKDYIKKLYHLKKLRFFKDGKVTGIAYTPELGDRFSYTFNSSNHTGEVNTILEMWQALSDAKNK